MLQGTMADIALTLKFHEAILPNSISTSVWKSKIFSGNESIHTCEKYLIYFQLTNENNEKSWRLQIYFTKSINTCQIMQVKSFKKIQLFFFPNPTLPMSLLIYLSIISYMYGIHSSSIHPSTLLNGNVLLAREVSFCGYHSMNTA